MVWSDRFVINGIAKSALDWQKYKIGHDSRLIKNIIMAHSMTNKIKGDEAEIVKEIKHEMRDVKAIYLFGSVARGNDTPKSDYDIAIIVKRHHPRKDLNVITKIKCALIDKIKRPLDIVILDVKDLSHSPILLYELYTNRKKLYGRVDVLQRSKSIVNKIKPVVEDDKKVGYHVTG